MNALRGFDSPKLVFYGFSIVVPFLVAFSWGTREVFRQKSFLDLGYKFVPDSPNQCDKTVSSYELGGVDYDDKCEALLGQTGGLIWEMILIPIAVVLLLTFIAKARGFGELTPMVSFGAWLIASIVGALVFGFTLPIFVLVPVLVALSIGVILIQNW